MPPPPVNGRQRAFLAAHLVFGTLATFFVVARFTAKRMKRLGCTVDDYLLLVALVSVYALMANAITSLVLGNIGQHASSTTHKQLNMSLVFLWVYQFLHAFALNLTRCSISILFMRLFYTHMFPKLRITAWACIGASILCLLIRVVVVLLRCRPVHYNWQKPLENSEHCYPLKPTVIALAAFGLIIDGVTWSGPHFVVWKLQLRRAHKMAITSIFTLGILNIVIGVACIATYSALDFTSDITYDAVAAIMWDMAQASTALILACCPLLRPVFEKIVPKRLTRIVTKVKTQKKDASIRIVTRIHVDPASSRRHV